MEEDSPVVASVAVAAEHGKEKDLRPIWVQVLHQSFFESVAIASSRPGLCNCFVHTKVAATEFLAIKLGNRSLCS